VIAGSDELPPPESEDWDAERWIQWIVEHPETGADRDRRSTRRPGGSSVGSQMLAGAMLGLRDVLYGPVDDKLVVVQALDEPDDDSSHINVHLDRDDPAASYAQIRTEGPDR
jgi:hypothetical protein